MARNCTISVVIVVFGAFLHLSAGSQPAPRWLSFRWLPGLDWHFEEAAVSEVGMVLIILGGVLLVGALLVAQFKERASSAG